MLTKKRLPIYIFLIFFIELLIYFWATWSCEAEFIFDKCARNSGRASSAILLFILLMIGFYGLKKIFSKPEKKETLQVLMLLFSINHLIHFFFVATNFQNHSMVLSISENLHGFISFIFIILVPIILLRIKRLDSVLYTVILLYLVNTSYFIMQTFYSKITVERPAYHNQFGILVISLTLGYILYRVIREISQSRN